VIRSTPRSVGCDDLSGRRDPCRALAVVRGMGARTAPVAFFASRVLPCQSPRDGRLPWLRVRQEIEQFFMAATVPKAKSRGFSAGMMATRH
jgi:hypothetical protein